MKEEILKRIDVALRALNNVSVCGKPNLTNLSGAISLLEEASTLLKGADIAEETFE